MARLLRRALGDALRQLQGMTPEQLVEQRIQRLLSYGAFQEVRAPARAPALSPAPRPRSTRPVPP